MSWIFAGIIFGLLVWNVYLADDRDYWRDLAESKDTGFTPEEVSYFLGSVVTDRKEFEEHKKRWDEWGAWKEAESEGRLLIPPAAVDAPLWVVRDGAVYDFYTSAITLYRDDGRLQYSGHYFKGYDMIVGFGEIGDDLFLTREEADAALKEAKA